VSAYVDLALGSLVTARAVSVLTYSQTIALLPDQPVRLVDLGGRTARDVG